MKKAGFLFLMTLVATPALPAQIQEDPREKMQEILEQVAEEMNEIDKLLQQSGRTKEAAEGLQRNAERLEKLLKEVGSTQERVVENIERLLKEAEKLKGEGDGC